MQTVDLNAISFRPALIRVLDDVRSAVVCELGLALSKSHASHEPSGFFYKPSRDWELDYGITRRDLEHARKVLTLKGVLTEWRHGSPFRLYLRFDEKKVRALLSEKGTSWFRCEITGPSGREERFISARSIELARMELQRQRLRLISIELAVPESEVHA